MGILFVCTFATLQFVFVIGHIQIQSYIVPTVVGSTLGFLLGTWYARLIQAKRALQAHHERLKTFLAVTDVGTWDWNPITNEVHYDDKWCHLIGYEPNELAHTFSEWQSRVHPDDLSQIFHDIKEHVDDKKGFFVNVFRMKHRQGYWVYILTRGHVSERNASGNPSKISGTNIDITHLKEAELELEKSNRKLHELSVLDDLTNLKNRRALDDYMLQAWGHWQRSRTCFSVLMIDIDFFKQFNDIYGHLAGDDCLKQVANVIQESAKRDTDIAVRYGGEEFLLVLSDVEQAQAEHIAEQLRGDIEDQAIPHHHNEITHHQKAVVTVSIGVSSCDCSSHCLSFLDPIRQADQALYLAKKRGRNQVSVFSEESN